jgi:2-polyprenyl-3-methyl-5-hydroxy-6-metoxy-1,4-benzoquinol methylase
MKFNNLLEEKNPIVLEDLLLRCFQADGNIDTDAIRKLSEEAARATNENKPLPGELNKILEKWYNSLSTGTPDYSVYGESEYIAELWACWKVYSKQHLRNIQKSTSLVTRSISSSHQSDTTIVDLGCGFAYTTAAITQIFPNARVYGTNLDGTLQMTVAKTMAADYNFTMSGDPSEIETHADLAFASEYFEHFERPIDHLDYVVETINPKAMLIANAFGPIAIGHFREYEIFINHIVGYEKIEAKRAGKLFNDRMAHHGYVKVKTKLWNNRPAYWAKK